MQRRAVIIAAAVACVVTTADWRHRLRIDARVNLPDHLSADDGRIP
jgi:hypothetical protein